MQRFKPVFVLFLLLALLGAGIIAFSLLIPGYIEKQIIPNLGRRLDSTLTGRVYHLGLVSADVGEISLGDPRNPVLSVGSIHADYSPTFLLTKKPARIRINGLTLRLQVADGRIVMPGVALERAATRDSGEESAGGRTGIDLPVALAELQLDNGLVELDFAGGRLLLPFNLQLRGKTTEDDPPVYDLSLQLILLGEKIILDGTVDVAGNAGIFSLAAEALDLTQIAALLGDSGNGLTLGQAAVRGETAIRLQPFQLLSAHLDIDPSGFAVGEIPLRFGKTAANAAVSLDLAAGQEGLRLTAEAAIAEPLAASLDLAGSVIRNQDGRQSSGNLTITMRQFTAAPMNGRSALSLQNDIELTGDFALALAQSGTWQGELHSPGRQQKNSSSKALRLGYGPIRLQTGMPSLEIRGRGTAVKKEGQLTVVLPAVQMTAGGTAIDIPAVSLAASYNQAAGQEQGGPGAGDFRLTLNGTKLQRDTLQATADIVVHGGMRPQQSSVGKPRQAEGEIRMANAAISAPESGIAVSGIAGNIPWFRPPAAGGKMTGEIKAERIEWRHVDLGSLAADITLEDMIYSLAGSYRSNLFKDMVMKVSGRAGVSDASRYGELSLQADTTAFTAIDLGRFDPALQDSTLSGELAVESFLAFGPEGLHGSMRLGLSNGVFEVAEKNYRITDIDFNMLLPSLPDMRTAPAQTMHFGEAAIGSLLFRQGRFVWQLESPDSFFLEEGMVQWAGGRVFTHAVRLSPGMKEFTVPIFCDRLKLAEMLQQFGISGARGEGTVNGRIPMAVGKNTIRFEDGFLYSSPGEGGSVKVEALDLLAAGIPKNTPQFAQVDFAAAALRNFQYDWVKLLLNTEGEDLIMQMQMDGEPVQSLPFSYDSRTGQLQRTEDGSPGIKQPVRLDVNFRLPLNRFLGYSGRIQDIMKKIQ